MARPCWEPTAKDRRVVRLMSAYGIPEDAIAAVLGITKPTLEKRCRHDLDVGLAEANSAVARSMFNMATRAPYSVRYPAAAFWLKCRAGWRDVHKTTMDMLIPVDQMTDEQFDRVLKVNGLPRLNDPRPSASGDGVVPLQHQAAPRR
jgi:hypothetical protein